MLRRAYLCSIILTFTKIQTKSHMTIIPYLNSIWSYQFQNGTLFVDAKPIIKTVFSSAANFLVDVVKQCPTHINEGGRNPIWVEVSEFEAYFKSKSGATCANTEIAEKFVWQDFKDILFDTLYEQGQTQFVSERRRVADELAAKQLAAKNLAELETLRLDNELMKSQLREITLAEIEEAKKQWGFRLINFFHNPFFPVLFGLGMMVVLGAFSVHICVDKMGIDPYLATGYAVIFEFFPLMCAVWGFQFQMTQFWKEKKERKDFYIDPLWVTMGVHTLFILFHVGLLDSRGDELFGALKLNPILAIGFILMPPFMQKTAMGLILKIAGIYKRKGWMKITE